MRILKNGMKLVIVRAYRMAKLPGKMRGIRYLPAGILEDRHLYSE